MPGRAPPVDPSSRVGLPAMGSVSAVGLQTIGKTITLGGAGGQSEARNSRHATGKGMNRPATPKTIDSTKAGWTLVGIILALEVWLLAATHGIVVSNGHRIALYVGVALITGITFWLVTPGSSAVVSVPHLGLKLGGGAAI